MKKNIYVSIVAVLLMTSQLFGNFSGIKNDILSIDKQMKNKAQALIKEIPAMSRYNDQEEKTFYTMINENGNIDTYILVRKTLDNSKYSVNISIDTSIDNVERIYNLLKSFDYLSNKENYQKLSVGNIEFIAEGNEAFISYVFEENKGRVEKGVLIKVLAVDKNSGDISKDDMTRIVSEIIKKINISKIQSIL